MVGEVAFLVPASHGREGITCLMEETEKEIPQGVARKSFSATTASFPFGGELDGPFLTLNAAVSATLFT